MTEDIRKLMYRMSLPAIIGMSINGINAFVDALFVGQLIGEDALAAISLALPLTMITNGFTAMIGVGASSLLSIAIGSGDGEVQRKTFATLTTLSIVVSVFLTGLGVYFAQELIALMGGKGEVLVLGTVYYRIMMLGAFFRVFAVASNMLVRAEGKIKLAMIIVSTSLLLNMVLNPILIAGFNLGIAGAAWATVISTFLFAVASFLYFLLGKTSYPIDLWHFNLETRLLRPILAVGTSAMLLQIMFFVQQAFIFRTLAHYGTDRDIAFMGACYRIIILMVVPIFGFAQAFQPIVGINFGAGNRSRVRKAFRIFTRTSTVGILIIWILLMIFPETVLQLMLPDTDFTFQDIFNYRTLLFLIPAFPFFFISLTLFQSIGNATASTVLQLSRELGLYIPFILILPLFFGVPGVYMAGIPVNLIVSFIAYFMVRRQFNRWKLSPSYYR